MKNLLLFSSLIIVITAACRKESSITSPVGNSQSSAQSNMRGEVTMPAYYDSMLFTINAKQFSAQAAEQLMASNPQLHNIYKSMATLPGDEMFVPVLSADHGDDFNPIWIEQMITFTGSAPHQFFSDDEVNSAAESGLITLTQTGNVFRCAIIGRH